jgi:hypothetical protein
MACTNRDLVLVVALVGASFYTVPVMRSTEKEERLLSVVDDFMQNHVLVGIRPEDTSSRIIAVVGA